MAIVVVQLREVADIDQGVYVAVAAGWIPDL